MNSQFARAVAAIPGLFKMLDESPALSFGHEIPRKTPGVYAFFREGKAVHVGRTKDLRSRLRNHVTLSHNSASFAFKQTRTVLGIKASYKAKGSRAELEQDPSFSDEFRRQIELVRSGQFRYVQIGDAVAQYLLELYAHMEYGLPLDEFDTH